MNARPGTNTIRLSGADGYAPDIDALRLSRPVEAEDPGNSLAGGAARSGCDGCSGGAKVGYLGQSGTLEAPGLSVTTAGNKTVRIDYASADPRAAQPSVNGGAPVSVSFPATGSWSTTATTTVGLDLAAGTNTLRFSAPGGYAPDIDRIRVPD